MPVTAKSGQLIQFLTSFYPNGTVVIYSNGIMTNKVSCMHHNPQQIYHDSRIVLGARSHCSDKLHANRICSQPETMGNPIKDMRTCDNGLAASVACARLYEGPMSEADVNGAFAAGPCNTSQKHDIAPTPKQDTSEQGLAWCVPMLYGQEISMRQVQVWIEYHRMLGVTEFHFYVSAHITCEDCVQYLKQQPNVVLHWVPLPVAKLDARQYNSSFADRWAKSCDGAKCTSTRASYKDFTQLWCMDHCLKEVQKSQEITWAMFGDMDEFLMFPSQSPDKPHRPNIITLLNSIHPARSCISFGACSYCNLGTDYICSLHRQEILL